jgi:energy-converting hydrogenase Eha subunit H
MANVRPVRNRIQFVLGLVLAIASAAVMAWTDVDAGPLALIGIVGLALIATSGPGGRLLR